MRRMLVVVLVLGPLGSVLGQGPEEKARLELQPRPATIQSNNISVTEALAQLGKQTGNQVVDKRRSNLEKKIKLNLNKVTFWPALEEIAQAAGAGISLYEGEGQALALIDRPLRGPSVVHQGLCRLAPRSVSLVRDEETGAHLCLLDLEIAWEPRLQPFYLSVGPMTATFAPDKKEQALQAKQEARGRTPVLGKTAGEIKVILPAPERSVPAIAALEGTMSLLAPSKMVRFDFSGLKEGSPRSETRDEVKVSVTRIKTTADRWTFDVLIENPKDGPVFESYQTYDWLFHNRIALEHKDGKTIWLSDPAENEDVSPASSYRAHISYHFTKKNGSAPARSDLENWKLVYLTPGRMVELQVPFTLKNIQLP